MRIVSLTKDHDQIVTTTLHANLAHALCKLFLNAGVQMVSSNVGASPGQATYIDNLSHPHQPSPHTNKPHATNTTAEIRCYLASCMLRACLLHLSLTEAQDVSLVTAAMWPLSDAA